MEQACESAADCGNVLYSGARPSLLCVSLLSKHTAYIRPQSLSKQSCFNTVPV